MSRLVVDTRTLCGMDPQPCPNHAAHTPCPRGYLAWHEWSEKKAKTHRQVRCDGCGLFSIWIPKGKR